MSTPPNTTNAPGLGPARPPTPAGELAAGRLLIGWAQAAEERTMGFGAGRAPAGVPPAATAVFTADLEGHVATIGPTGSGKGVGCLMPTLLTYPGSVIVVDVKGEAVEVAARRRQRMGQTVVVIDPFEVTTWGEAAGFNPLDIQTLTGGPIEDLAMELPGLMRGTGGKSHGGANDGEFWDIRADGLIAGVLAHLLHSNSPTVDRSLVTLRDLLMDDDPVYCLATLMDKAGKTMPALAARQIASFLNTVEVTRSGILATATERVSALFHPGVERALARTTFDLGALREGAPMSLFLVVPPGKLLSHGRVLRIWIAALLSLLQSRTRRPARPTLFLVDEAAQLGAMDQLRTALTLLRGYAVRTITYWQDVSQLKRLYGDWETLLNNCAVQILGANTLAAARAAADLTGPVLSPEQILQLPGEQAIFVEKGRARVVRKLNYLTDDLFRGLAAPHPMYADAGRRRRVRRRRVIGPAAPGTPTAVVAAERHGGAGQLANLLS